MIDSTRTHKIDEGKAQHSFIPPKALEEVAKVLTFGAVKYSPYSWTKVESSRYLDATLRHLNQTRDGDNKDAESGLSHLAHAITNLMFLLERELDKSGLLGVPLQSFTTEVVRAWEGAGKVVRKGIADELY